MRSVPDMLRSDEVNRAFLLLQADVLSDPELDPNDWWLNAIFTKNGSVWRDLVRTVRGTLAGNHCSDCCARFNR